MRLIYHPEAEAEVVDAARFYAARGANLGIRFLDAIDERWPRSANRQPWHKRCKAMSTDAACQNSPIAFCTVLLQANYES